MKLDEIIVLNEAREGNLYHATSYLNAIKIIYQNEILGKTSQTFKIHTPGAKAINVKDVSKKLDQYADVYNYGTTKYYRGVSLTRDIRFALNWAENYGDPESISGVVFSLNHNLLYRDFGKRIVPIDYFQTTAITSIVPDDEQEEIYADEVIKNRRIGQYAEAEEFVIGDIKNLEKYLVGITLITDFNTIDQIKNYNAAIASFEKGSKLEDDFLKHPKLSFYNPFTKKLTKPVIKEYVDDIVQRSFRLW